MKKLLMVFLAIGLVMAGASFATTLSKSPTSCSGAWTSCANANANGGGYASATATSSSSPTGTWNNYGFSLASDATISSVKIKPDFWATNTRGRLDVRVSWDGGTTWSSTYTVGPATSETTFTIDVTGTTSWTPSKLSNANLVVEAKCRKSGSGSNPNCRLDYVPVEVVYTEPPLPFDFSMSASPSSGTVSISSGNFTKYSSVYVTLVSGTTENVNLALSGCPAATTCQLSATSGNPTYSPLLTVTVTGATPIGIYPIVVTGNSASLTRQTTYTLTVNS